MTASWPGDSATVTRWLRASLRHAATDGDIRLSGMEDIRVTADVAGLDLRELRVDATKVHLRVHPQPAATPVAAPEVGIPEVAASEDPAAEPEPVRRERGTAHSVRFMALPMRIQRTRVTIDVRAHDVPISWLTFAEPVDPTLPESINALVPDDDSTGMRGTFRIAIATDDLGPLITAVARPALRESGVRLGRVRLDITSADADGVRVTGSAGIRWKLLVASARVDATLDVTPGGIITVRTLTVGSRNLAVKFALLFVRSHVRAAVGKSLDLNQAMIDSGVPTRIQDLRVGTGRELSVTARFG